MISSNNYFVYFMVIYLFSHATIIKQTNKWFTNGKFGYFRGLFLYSGLVAVIIDYAISIATTYVAAHIMDMREIHVLF